MEGRDREGDTERRGGAGRTGPRRRARGRDAARRAGVEGVKRPGRGGWLVERGAPGRWGRPPFLEGAGGLWSGGEQGGAGASGVIVIMT